MAQTPQVQAPQVRVPLDDFDVLCSCARERRWIDVKQLTTDYGKDLLRRYNKKKPDRIVRYKEVTVNVLGHLQVIQHEWNFYNLTGPGIFEEAVVVVVEHKEIYGFNFENCSYYEISMIDGRGTDCEKCILENPIFWVRLLLQREIVPWVNAELQLRRFPNPAVRDLEVW